MRGRGLPARLAAVAMVASGCGSGGAARAPASQPPSGDSSLSASMDTPAATPSTVAFADCSRAVFGPPLAPLNPPANVHVYSGIPAMSINVARLYRMTVTTTRGLLVLCLQPQLAPATVNTIVTLVRNHFYDGLIFHRVEANFVIQGGDPTGTGEGGPGFEFDNEPVRNAYVPGAVAMANAGVNTNGSQFFICLGPVTAALPTVTPLTPVTAMAGASPVPAVPSYGCASLPRSYSLFGKLESGRPELITPGTVMTTVTVAEQQ